MWRSPTDRAEAESKTGASPFETHLFQQYTDTSHADTLTGVSLWTRQEILIALSRAWLRSERYVDPYSSPQRTPSDPCPYSVTNAERERSAVTELRHAPIVELQI